MRLLAIVLCIMASTALGATIAVPGDYATIGEAVLNSTGGDVVVVQPGTYNEANITVPHPLEIRSAVAFQPVTISGSSVEAIMVIADFSGRVALIDLTLENGLQGIEHSGNDDFELDLLRCRFLNHAEYGLVASNNPSTMSRFTATHCAFNGNGDTGLYLVQFNESTVEHCEFANNDELGAFAVSGTHAWNHVEIRDNGAVGLGGGAWFTGGDGVLNDILFEGNAAAHGGGLTVGVVGDWAVNDCVFSDNIATHGNDAAIMGDLGFVPNVVFHCCTIDEDQVFVSNGVVEFDNEGCTVGVQSRSLSSIKKMFR